MANTAQARKRVRQSEKRRQLKSSQRSMVRTYIKRVYSAVAAKDADSAKTALADAIPVIDRMANKGVIHKNKAARHKSRLSAQVKSLSA
jgi:small subunit ribosomal protein S20